MRIVHTTFDCFFFFKQALELRISRLNKWLDFWLCSFNGATWAT
jgi:hypothetical protein